MGWIQARVWKSYIPILVWFGPTARFDSNKMRCSLRSTTDRWHLDIRAIFHILGRQFVHQIQVNTGRVFGQRRGFVGESKRTTFLNIRRQGRCEWLRCLYRRWVLVFSQLFLRLHNSLCNEIYSIQLVVGSQLGPLECRWDLPHMPVKRASTFLESQNLTNIVTILWRWGFI